MLSFPQEPMLARPVDQLPAEDAMPDGCLYEPKFDGYRALLFIYGGGCRVQSRRGHDISASFPDVAKVAVDQLPPGVVLDGELVVWADGRLEFSELQRRLTSESKAAQRARRRPASFVAFDVLCVDGQDARGNAFRDRRAVLKALLAGAAPPLQLAPQTAERGEAQQWMAGYAAEPVGLEGIVVKGAKQRYRSGKREWMKVRVRDTIEVIVGAVTGSLTSPDRLVLGQYNTAGELVIVGGTSSLNSTQRRSVAPLLRAADDEHPWPAEISEGRLGHWGRGKQPITRVDPTLIVEVSVDNAVDAGRRRHVASFVRVRPDLTIEETEVI